MLSPRRCARVARDAPARASGRPSCSGATGSSTCCTTIRTSPSARSTRATSASRGPATIADFEAWCRGETGFGLVDAGMRQLAEAGYQPNRIRMVCASFLCKHLHVDWRRGEQLVPIAPRRRRPVVERGRLAVGRRHGPRCGALLPRHEPAAAAGEVRSATASTSSAGRPTGPPPMLDLAAERARALELYGARDPTDEKAT